MEIDGGKAVWTSWEILKSSSFTRLVTISMSQRQTGVGGIIMRSKVSHMVGSQICSFPHASMNNILTPAMIAAATVSGLAAYFLGLSSLSDLLIADDPVERVKNLKDMLEVGSAVRRGKDNEYYSVWNDQDPETRPPGTPPPGFQNGDEVPCADARTSSGNTVVAIPNCFITTQVYHPYPNPLSIRHSNTIHLQRSSYSQPRDQLLFPHVLLHGR